MRIKTQIIALLIFFAKITFANNQADSLLAMLAITRHDSSKAELYFELANTYSSIDTKAQLAALLKAEKLFEKIPFRLHKVSNLVNLGYWYFQDGDFIKSEKYYLRAINEAKRVENLDLEFTSTEHYLDRFININSPVKSLERIFELKERTMMHGDKKLLFKIYELINEQYLILGIKLAERRKYADSMLVIAEAIQDTLMLRTAYFNIAVSTEQGKEAIQYYHTSLEYVDRKNDIRYLSSVFNNLSGKYRFVGELDLAVAYADSAYFISKLIDRPEGMAAARLRKAEAVFFKKEFKKSITYAKEALQIFKDINILRRQNSCAHVISESYKELGDYKNALQYFELRMKLTDSLKIMTDAQEAEFIDRKFNYDLSIKRDSIKFSHERIFNNLKIESMNAQIEKDRIQKYSLYGGILVVILFAILIWIGLQRKRKANLIIEQQKIDVERQKEEIEQQHLEMKESITYAKRIQAAILPPDKLVKQYLKQSFILYKPKAIVAGDFYWIERIGNIVLFAAADCTGHGVPGAMVSVVCNNALNRTVRESSLTEPGKILDKTREIVIQEFGKSDEDVKDGMDISLCGLDLNNNILTWSGANNPLWIIRPVRHSGLKPESYEIMEYKADKQPIGKHAEAKPFTTHQIQLQKDDSIYIFTDGFQDQFGGEKGKKYKAAKLRELLLSVQNELMERQCEIIDHAFEEWKGNLEQVDDVCVIGVKI